MPLMPLRKSSLLNTFRLGALLLCSTFLAGCVKDYVPPTSKQPHALVKFRRRYKQPMGSELVEELRVNKRRAFYASESAKVAKTARTETSLVYPGVSEFDFRVGFSHTEMTTRNESYACGSSTCSRTVIEPREVSDGYCRRLVRTEVRKGAIYLWSMVYKGRKSCSLSCFRQEPQGNGEFKNHACEFEVLDD